MVAPRTREVERVAGRVAAGGAFLHVWRVSVDRPRRSAAELATRLSRDERERARRFADPGHGALFATHRVLLRTLLGVYLGRRPEEIRFGYGEHGKPSLAAPPALGLSFNLAHSGSDLLVALSRHRAVGVDLEHVRDDVGHEMLARQFFSTGEVSALERLPRPLRRAAFFRCWTRKEAFVKARGDGLALPLHRFQVSCPPEPAALLEVEGMKDEAARWTLLDLPVGPRTAASVAVERPAPVLELWRWEP